MTNATNALWETHKHKTLVAFFLLLILFVALILTGFGYGLIASSESRKITNLTPIQLPEQDNSTVPPIIQTQTGVTAFTLPNIIGMNQPYDAYVNCTISSAFVQNAPSNITIQILFPAITQAMLHILYIQVQPVNALVAFPDWTSPSGYSQLSSTPNFFMPLHQTNDYGAEQVWSSLGDYPNTYIFEDSGLVSFQITMEIIPTDEMQSVANWTIIQNDYSPFKTTVTIPNTFMDSIETVQLQQTEQTWEKSMLAQSQLLNAIENQTYQQQKEFEIQQNANGDFNLSLTFFVLAIMVLDIAIIIYDHSIDENKKTVYENKQANRNNKSILEYVQ